MPFVRQVYAQAICNPVLPWTCGRPGEQILSNLITSLLAAALALAGILSFGYLIVGGIQWITSAGDKAGLESARNRIMHAVIGLILVASTFAIMTFVADWLGLPFPNIVIPTINKEVFTVPSGCIKNPTCSFQPGAACTGINSCRKLGDGEWYCCP